MINVNPETGYVYSTEGFWLPPINIKQYEIFECKKRYLLVHGPRLSGKTWGLVHKTIRHAFDVDGAMVAIVTKTLKNAKSAGVWLLLSRLLLHWQKSVKGFKILDGPRTTGDTKMSFVKIRNRHGTVSEIQCHSLEHAQDVEAKFKGSAYSFFWLSEVDQFCTEHAFDIFCDALRMTPFVPFEDHQIMCDCNPPDSGTENWIHDKWFKFKDAIPEDETEQTRVARDRLHRILVMIDDNPQLDPQAKADLIERYRKRKTWFNRFVLGIWERDIVDGHFSDVWDESAHVRGVDQGPEEDQEFLIPTAGCSTILSGWDMGEARNHSFHVVEKITVEDPATKKAIVSFAALDEYVVIKTYMSLHDFAQACMEKMEFWADWQKRQYNITVQWRHWSDSNAFEDRANTNACDAAIVYEATGGKVILQAAPKYSRSNHDKVKLLRELLSQRRLFIGAQLQATKAMFANLKMDKTNLAHFVKRDDHKHPFDSLSYPILAECPRDMLKSADLSTAAGKGPKVSGFVVARM